jgi:meso-butanediol dehydrogenase / (S,S)-butanediol dehydrogenase / diacetyl reductase
MGSPDGPPRLVTIVTGAGRGLGTAVCRRGRAGWGQVLVARCTDQLAIAAELTADGASAVVFGGDAGDPTLPGRVVATAVERYGRIDTLVNNAGAYRRGEATRKDDGDWRRCWTSTWAPPSAWPAPSVRISSRRGAPAPS